MRLTREKAEQNRQTILDTAGRLFRERGFDGVGLNEVMSEAGFTHGGFYNHFASKEALAADVCRSTFGTHGARLAQSLSSDRSLTDVIDGFLSPAHRDAKGSGCPSASLAADAARLGVEIQAPFADGLESYIQSLAGGLATPDPALNEPARDDAERRALAMELLTQMVGALVLSRAVTLADPKMSKELLSAGRDAAVRLRTSAAPASSPPVKPRSKKATRRTVRKARTDVA